MPSPFGTGTEDSGHAGLTQSSAVVNDGTFIRNSVYKYLKSGQKSVEPSALVNVLKEVCSPMHEQNMRLDSLEVKITSLLKVVGTIAANAEITNKESILKINKIEKKVKRVAGFIPKLTNVVTNAISNFQAQIDQSMRSFDSRVSSMQKLQVHHLLKINEREQRSRGWSCRVHNWINIKETDEPQDVENGAKDDNGINKDDGATRDESTSTGENSPKQRKLKRVEELIFDRLIKPALIKAKEAGDADDAPKIMKDCIEFCHKLPGRRGTSGSPAYIFRFVRRPDLFNFLKHKMPLIKEINDKNRKATQTSAEKVKNGEFRDLRVGADLTDLNRQVLTWLHNQESILYSKVSGNRVVYQLRDQPGQWLTCLNPFARSVDMLSTPPVDVTQYLFESYEIPPPFLQTMRRPNLDRRSDFRMDIPPTTLAGGGGEDRGAFGGWGHTDDNFRGGRGSVGSYRGQWGAYARAGVMSKGTELVQQMDTIRRQLDEEVVRLSDDLDQFRDSQDAVIHTAVDIATEIQNVLEESNIMAEDNPEDNSEDESDNESVVITNSAFVAPVAILPTVPKENPPADNNAGEVIKPTAVVVDPEIAVKSPAKLTSMAVVVDTEIAVKSPAKLTSKVKKAATAVKSPAKLAGGDKDIADPPADSEEISGNPSAELPESPPKNNKKNTRGRKNNPP